jgi:hypothetical protein
VEFNLMWDEHKAYCAVCAWELAFETEITKL